MVYLRSDGVSTILTKSCPDNFVVCFMFHVYFDIDIFVLRFCHRILANTLQHYILYTFRKILVSSPALLEIFRKEGIWDLIFSENFFYFAPALDDYSGEISTYPDHVQESFELYSSSRSSKSQVKSTEVEILQMEVISFVEFAATLDGNAHNLVFLLHCIFIFLL